MKIILSSRRRHYAARVSIFLIAVALIAGMVGCVPPPGGPFKLTITSTTGGSVTTPGEGAFTYPKGTVVNLFAEAEAEEGYQFFEWTGDVDTIADVNAATTTIIMNDDYFVTAHFGWFNITITQVAAGYTHTVGRKNDGTVVAVGEKHGDVDGWTDIIQVAAGGYHTVGLKSDSTVVAVGWNNDGQCDVNTWIDIMQVAAGGWGLGGHTVGLKYGGTVVAVGNNSRGQCNVGG